MTSICPTLVITRLFFRCKLECLDKEMGLHCSKGGKERDLSGEESDVGEEDGCKSEQEPEPPLVAGLNIDWEMLINDTQRLNLG